MTLREYAPPTGDRTHAVGSVGSHSPSHLKPGTVVVSADCGSTPESACFLCTAPPPRAEGDGGRVDCEQAYMVGLLQGVLAMKGDVRAPLCPRHERSLRELLVQYFQDEDTLRKLGIETMVSTTAEDEIDNHNAWIIGSLSDEPEAEADDAALIPVDWVPGVGLVDRS